MAYDQVEPGPTGWSKFEIWPRKVRHACCFCDGVHEIEMRVDAKKRVWFRWKINNRATAAMRRKR